MDVYPSSRKQDEGKEVYVSRSNFRYAPDELTFTEQPVVPQKIYIVSHNGHEFDDLDYGASSPVFLSLDRGRARSMFDRFVEQARQQGRESQANYGQDYYEEDSDNTDDIFCYFLGKWCYTYWFDEFFLDSEKMTTD